MQLTERSEITNDQAIKFCHTCREAERKANGGRDRRDRRRAAAEAARRFPMEDGALMDLLAQEAAVRGALLRLTSRDSITRRHFARGAGMNMMQHGSQMGLYATQGLRTREKDRMARQCTAASRSGDDRSHAPTHAGRPEPDFSLPLPPLVLPQEESDALAAALYITDFIGHFTWVSTLGRSPSSLLAEAHCSMSRGSGSERY